MQIEVGSWLGKRKFKRGTCSPRWRLLNSMHRVLQFRAEGRKMGKMDPLFL